MDHGDAHLIWKPTRAQIQQSELMAYIQWLKKTQGLEFAGYDDLWDWSVKNISEFWESLWNYFGILHSSPYNEIVSSDPMPSASWFSGAELNFAEHIFRNATNERPAILFSNEAGEEREVTWDQLTTDVASLQTWLSAKGIQQGDRIVAYLPNIPEATVGLLTASAMGLVWSSCSPDFGVDAVIDRFAQIEPKVLIAIDGYHYGGKQFDKRKDVRAIIRHLPTVEHVLVVHYIGLETEYKNGIDFSELINSNRSSTIEFKQLPFSHPIWVLYSSGTTGIPKAITHSQGGVLMELLKYLTFHNDVHPGDRSFWYTTTGWMMWNYLHGALLCGAIIVQYDGSPAFPDTDQLFRLAERWKITHLGTSASYIVANMKAGTSPGSTYNLQALSSIGSTGSPLPPEGFDWIHQQLPGVWLTSLSGGTDVCSAFVGGCRIWPVYSGEIQCRALGCDLRAYDINGNPVEGEVGEMVIQSPMPSMPIYFWNDPDNERYLESYFSEFPNVWRHGDWIRITSRQGVIIYGRSDATLNRGGIRIGTSEIYRAVNTIDEISDSLIVCIELENGEFYMPLFVKTAEEVELTEDLKSRVNTTIRKANSPRHVPDEVLEVADIPYTISGKKTESPVKKILMGMDPEKAIKKDALRNPDALLYFIKLAKSIRK